MNMPRVKRMTEAESIAEGERILAKDHSETIRLAERVRKMPYPTPPTSLRLSAPLLEALERIAAVQHRKRTGLIQHVLWEYVQAHDPVFAREPEAPKAKTLAAQAGKKVSPARKRVMKAKAS
jgi:hypothetical protein